MEARGEPTADVSAGAGWSKAELWAWVRILRGDIADFTIEHGALDAGQAEGWTDDRTLSAAFLRAILFEKIFTEKIRLEGVRISGVRWMDALSLPHANIKWPLCLEKCRFERPVDFTGLHLDARLSFRKSFFQGADRERSLILDGAAIRRADLSNAVVRTGLCAEGAAFEGRLDLTGATIGGDLDLERSTVGCLFLRDASAEDIVLSNCEIGQDADFSGARVEGTLKMNDIRVGQDLSLGGSEKSRALFRKEIVLEGGYVGGSVTFTGADVKGAVRMNGLQIEKNLFLRSSLKSEKEKKGKTVFGAKVDVSNAVIKGYLELLGARFRGPVEMTGVQIGENLSGWGTASEPTIFHRPISFISARIKGTADLGGALFHDNVNFTAARIEGSLYFNGATVFDKILNLADARVGGHFFMKEADGASPRCKGEVKLQNTSVAGHLELNALCESALSCQGLKVGLRLFLSTSGGGEVRGLTNFSYAEVKGDASFDGGTFTGGLNMEGIEVGQELSLRATIKGPIILASGNVGGSLNLNASTEYRIDLRSLRVGRDLDVRGKFGPATPSARERIDLERKKTPDPGIFTYGEADMRDLQIGRDLRLGATFWDPVKLSQAQVARVLTIVDADFKEGVDLSASIIGGQLCLQLPPPRSSRIPDADGNSAVELDLRDVKASSLQIRAKTVHSGGDAGWPGKGSVQLDGFIYERLGGSGVDPSEE
ncbi:MAG: hypothetical protein JWO81_2328, partial [Alphaproteobacteria bacterium]|nr:hypothetical protein [Alphaproteobacteria bacterium]